MIIIMSEATPGTKGIEKKTFSQENAKAITKFPKRNLGASPHNNNIITTTYQIKAWLKPK